MNLIFGNIVDNVHAKKVIKNLDKYILKAKEAQPLNAATVISACDKLSSKLSEDDIKLLIDMGVPQYKAEQEFRLLKLMLSKEYLENRLKTEFGTSETYEYEEEYKPCGYDVKVRHKFVPLGTLFHISAGNVELLAAFSIIEGLLTGNINIVKLASSDDGLSVMLLKKLIDIEPLLKSFIFVFDIVSDDIKTLKKISRLSDALVVWGSDEAIRAARTFAGINTRIIEWGHKISFAYVSYDQNIDDIADKELYSIAYNICDTNQLFCNSCQGILLDSTDFNELKTFAKRFLTILEEVAKSMPYEFDIRISAAKRLELYTEQLESLQNYDKLILQGENVNVIVYKNQDLKTSHMFRNPWIKALPKEQLLKALLPYKNYLQTVALICPQGKRHEFEDIFSKSGAVRICSGKNMSISYCGMPHDGEFALRRYMKVMSYEVGE